MDKDLCCAACANSFVFTRGEQEFFRSRGLENEPKKCPNCRVLSRVKRSGKSIENTSEVQCAECGQLTRVPFRPRGHKPVYCNSCFRSHRDAAPAAEERLAV